MPVQLADYRADRQDRLILSVIDEFDRQSRLMGLLTFDGSKTTLTGSTLRYTYDKLHTPSTAATRALNNEYTANESVRTTEISDIAILGGKIQVDRVLVEASGDSALPELETQMNEKIKATVNQFHWLCINGDSGAVATQFNGLDVLCTGTDTEYNAGGTTIDLSTPAALDANYQAFDDALTDWLSLFEEKPTALMMNKKMFSAMKKVAKRMGYAEPKKDDFGRTIVMYDDIEIIDLGDYYNGTTSEPIVPIDGTSGETSIYGAVFDLNGLHAATVQTENFLNSYMPNLDEPGAVKDGEVEMTACLVLKNTKKAGAMRKIKVA